MSGWAAESSVAVVMGVRRAGGSWAGSASVGSQVDLGD